MVLSTVGTWFFRRHKPELMSLGVIDDQGKAPDEKRKRRFRRAARNRRRLYVVTA